MKEQKKRSSVSLLFCGCHEGGEEQGFLDLGAQLLSLHSPLFFSFSPLPEFPVGFFNGVRLEWLQRRLSRSSQSLDARRLGDGVVDHRKPSIGLHSRPVEGGSRAVGLVARGAESLSRSRCRIA
jgi:hypothetical protein